jgi:hypothetical protein
MGHGYRDKSRSVFLALIPALLAVMEAATGIQGAATWVNERGDVKSLTPIKSALP